MDEFLWCDIYWHLDIKDSSPKQANHCDYTWEAATYIMITNKGRFGPYIWPKTPNQGTGTKDMILTTWYKKAMK